MQEKNSMPDNADLQLKNAIKLTMTKQNIQKQKYIIGL